MKYAKPWYRKQNNAWYIRFQGKQHLLARGRKNKKAAVDAAHTILSGDTPVIARAVRLHPIIDKWLADKQALASYAWYKIFLDDFKVKYGKLRVVNLKRAHLRKWIDQ